MIRAAVRVRIVVESSGKRSEAHNFTYTPVLEQPKNVVYQSNTIHLAASANHPCSGSLPTTIVTFPESSISSPLIVSTQIPVMHSQDSHLDYSHGDSSSLMSVSNADLQPSCTVTTSENTSAEWNSVKDLCSWTKPGNSNDESQAFTKLSSSDAKNQDSDNLRDLLTRQSEKMTSLPETDISLVSVDQVHQGNHPMTVASTCNSQLSDLDFGRNEIIQTVCTTGSDILTTLSGDPIMINVGTYSNSILENPTPPPVVVSNPLVSKSETSGTQGSIEHINMMTMLRDSELLQLINPSTFDNV